MRARDFIVEYAGLNNPYPMEIDFPHGNTYTAVIDKDKLSLVIQFTTVLDRYDAKVPTKLNQMIRDVSFYTVRGNKDNDKIKYFGPENVDDPAITNQNTRQTFRMLSTVAAAIRDYTSKRPQTKFLIYVPATNKLEKIYSRWVPRMVAQSKYREVSEDRLEEFVQEKSSDELYSQISGIFDTVYGAKIFERFRK